MRIMKKIGILTGLLSFLVLGCAAQNKKAAPLTVTIAPPAIKFDTTTLPGGTVGKAYAFTLTFSGGVAPYTCAVTGGTLPPAIALSTACAFAGTPTKAGEYSFVVTVTDSAKTTAQMRFQSKARSGA